MFARSLSRAVTLAVLVFTLSFIAAAQDLDTVTVAGKVTDSNGLAVVGATVTATLTETGEARSTTTDSDGLYKIINLKPGNYKIAVANSGFGSQETTAIPTIAAQRLQQDFKLAPADVKAETTEIGRAHV